MSEKQFYTVPFVWNKTLWVMTFAVFGLWLGLSGWFLYQILTQENHSEAVASLVMLNVIMLPLIVVCEGLAPQRLEVGQSKIVILRRYKSVTIESKDVVSIDRLPDGVLGHTSVRTCGVGGLFGFFGHYYNPSIGRFLLYATSFKNLYLVRMKDDRRIVFSCSEPELLNTFKLD